MLDHRYDAGPTINQHWGNMVESLCWLVTLAPDWFYLNTSVSIFTILLKSQRLINISLKFCQVNIIVIHLKLRNKRATHTANKTVRRLCRQLRIKSSFFNCFTEHKPLASTIHPIKTGIRTFLKSHHNLTIKNSI